MSRTRPRPRPRSEHGHNGPYRPEEKHDGQVPAPQALPGRAGIGQRRADGQWTPEELSAHVQYMDDFAAQLVEEVIRQAIPAREGRPDVSADNLVGTAIYFVLFNLGLIAVAVPVQVSSLTRTLDWPFLVASTWLATLFFCRGGVSRLQGGLLLALYAGYVVAHLLLR
jgi:hypothetical protein